MVYPDSTYHLFSHCPVLNFLWQKLDKVMEIMGYEFRFTNAKRKSLADFLSVKIPQNEFRHDIYLNSITNYRIWIISRNILYDDLVFEKKSILSAIVKTISSRMAMEKSDRMTHCQKIDNLERLLKAVKSAFFPPSEIG